LRHQAEQVFCLSWILGQEFRTCDRLRGIGDDAVGPAAYLVPEDPEATRQVASDRPFCNHATIRSVAVTYRCLLNHKAPRRGTYNERRVVEVAGASPLEPGYHRLKDASVQPHRMAACAEW
jgi:hypothetical protein